MVNANGEIKWKGASIFVSALIPVSYLVMEQLPSTVQLAKSIGPYYSGIATYVLSAVAMVVGSLLKPQQRLREESA
jgi:SSS family solute:Na+ symporter